MPIIDLTGKKFGRLTAIECVGKTKRNEAIWKCACDCGNILNVRSYPLKSGHTKSCGCLKKEEESNRKEHPHKKTHGLSGTRIYIIWCNMKSRCYNENNTFYSYYGGRGITVCEEWKNNFEAFYNWAMSNGYKENLEIDKIDNDKGYSPENCRWIDRTSQMNNIRNNKKLVFNGNEATIKDLARKYKIDSGCLRWRIDHGWDLEKALTTPSAKKYIEYQGEVKNISEWAKQYGLEYSCLQYRLANGWDVEKALKTPSKEKK